MSGIKDIAIRHYERSKAIAAAAVSSSRREWRKLDRDHIDESFYTEVWPQLLAVMDLAQEAAAGQADKYLDAISDAESIGLLDTDAFTGIAADGDDLSSLLRQPLITTKTVLSRGDTPARALAAGEAQLALIVGNEVTDAGRTADQVATVLRPELTGYVRMLVLPSCDRCAILAGRVYKWNDGFLRHPQCDCRHIPVSEDSDDMTTDPLKAIKAGRVTGLSQADRRAIEDGADPNQVINAKRGMYTAGGRKMTHEGTTTRGFAGQRLGAKKGRKRPPRTRPEEIYKVAANRDEAIAMLRGQGYVIE